MAIKSSGALALIADIEAEFSQGDNNISLAQAGVDAGLNAGDLGMFEFYGLSDVVSSAVTTNANSSTTHNSIQANGNVTSDGGGNISSRGFYFGTSSTYSNNTKYTVSGTTGSFSRNFTGLSSGTAYYATAFSINEVGESIGSTRGSTTTVLNIGSTAGISVSAYSKSAYAGSQLVLWYNNANFSSGTIPTAVTASGYTFGSGIMNITRMWQGSWSSGGGGGGSATLNSGSLGGRGIGLNMNQYTNQGARTIGHGVTFSASGYSSSSYNTHIVSVFS